jgi:hypothetical protein
VTLDFSEINDTYDFSQVGGDKRKNPKCIVGTRLRGSATGSEAQD